MSWPSRFLPDKFTQLLLLVVLLASVLPIRGNFTALFGGATQLAIALLFFLHGARLSRDAVVAGIVHWRLHLLVFASTYIMFPVLGLAIQALPSFVISPQLAAGTLFLCCLPSTVQSSIAFTSIARGNVPAALCSASFSNLIGVFLTPLLVGLLISRQSGPMSLGAVKAILLQILLPFLLGQLLYGWVGGWVSRHRHWVGIVDRGSILMVVYGAFSEAVVGGLWSQLSPASLGGMIAVNLVLLAIVLLVTTLASRQFGFNREDEIAIVFCGSKKSLASGIPMATVLFSGQAVGMIVLPLMLFHQIQLMACAQLARRYAQGLDR